MESVQLWGWVALAAFAIGYVLAHVTRGFEIKVLKGEIEALKTDGEYQFKAGELKAWQEASKITYR